MSQPTFEVHGDADAAFREVVGALAVLGRARRAARIEAVRSHPDWPMIRAISDRTQEELKRYRLVPLGK